MKIGWEGDLTESRKSDSVGTSPFIYERRSFRFKKEKCFMGADISALADT